MDSKFVACLSLDLVCKERKTNNDHDTKRHI